MQSLKQSALPATKSGTCAADHSFSRKRALFDVIVAFAGVMMALWTTGPTQKIVIGLALLWIASCAVRTWCGADKAGLSLSGFRESLWVVLVAVLLAGLLIFVAARHHTFHVVLRGHGPATSVAAYGLWSLAQEFILINVFLFRLLRLIAKREVAILATATLFAVAHVPNALLVAITFFWGITACVLFLRYKNLYTLPLAHAIVGLTLAITVPDVLQHQMRVGISYLHWHAPSGSDLSKPQ